MAQLHMTEAEISGNFSDVLAKVRDGAEVIVEDDHRPVAVIRSAQSSGRSISECIASAQASGSEITLDGGFAADVEEGIRSRREVNLRTGAGLKLPNEPDTPTSR